VAKIATGCVACLAHILDMGRSKRLATDDFGHNASHEVIVNRPYPVALADPAHGGYSYATFLRLDS